MNLHISLCKLKNISETINKKLIIEWLLPGRGPGRLGVWSRRENFYWISFCTHVNMLLHLKINKKNFKGQIITLFITIFNIMNTPITWYVMDQVNLLVTLGFENAQTSLGIPILFTSFNRGNESSALVEWIKTQLCQPSEAPSVVHKVPVILYEMGRTGITGLLYSLLLMETNGLILVFVFNH